LDGTGLEDLAAHFRGNVALFLSGEDPIAAAKLLKNQLKENKSLVVRVGFFEGTVLDASAVEAVAELPSREELLVTLLRTIQEGPRQILGVLQGSGRDLMYLLSNHANELENSGD
jgi:large subunit ribosomal protein L10